MKVEREWYEARLVSARVCVLCKVGRGSAVNKRMTFERDDVT